jgi:hypothetical protein
MASKPVVHVSIEATSDGEMHRVSLILTDEGTAGEVFARVLDAVPRKNVVPEKS